MRLVYFGSGAFGLPTLEKLIEQHDVALVVTRPDRPAGRKQKLTPTPIAEFASRRGLPVINFPDVNEKSVVDRIRSLEVDAFVVIAFGQKLGPRLLDRTFAINLHGSLLPKYRGAAPINWAMINGETVTGLSVIMLADRMDAGDVLAQISTPIDPMETAGELHDRLARLGPGVVLEVLRQREMGTIRAARQDERFATAAPKLAKADGTVCFDQPASCVRQRIHGVTPWPGCSITIDGRPLRILRAEVVEEQSRHSSPGTVLDDYSIACSPGTIRFLEVQPPGGKVMSFSAYRNGQPVTVGARCESA
jgi:methionyl-tRNA formyltransferase